MKAYTYEPTVMSSEEATSLVNRLSALIPKVDHYIARGQLHEIISELENEVDNIEKGYREPQHMVAKEKIKSKSGVRKKYGEWILVELDSGRWSNVWSQSEDIDGMMEAIKSEDTFWFSNQCGFAQPNIYATKSEALKKLVELIEESLRKDPENYADYYTPILKRVRTTLNKLVKSAL